MFRATHLWKNSLLEYMAALQIVLKPIIWRLSYSSRNVLWLKKVLESI